MHAVAVPTTKARASSKQPEDVNPRPPPAEPSETDTKRDSRRDKERRADKDKRMDKEDRKTERDDKKDRGRGVTKSSSRHG